MVGFGRGTELKNQEMVGGGLPVTTQSRTAWVSSMATTGKRAGSMMGATAQRAWKETKDEYYTQVRIFDEEYTEALVAIVST